MSSSIGPRSTWSEVLRLVNRSGNRPSHEGAAEEADEVIGLCRRAGFRKIVLRGDTAFSSSEKLDAWDEDGVTFYFGFKAMGNLEEIAENLPESDWKTLQRRIRYEANDRCDQENLIAQLAGSVRAISAPVDNLHSNWAYMLMTALAWNLKAWFALMLPEHRRFCEKHCRWREKHRGEKRRVLRMEFKTFLNAFIKLPCQIVTTGRRLIYRVLCYNPHLSVFFRLSDVLHG